MLVDSNLSLRTLQPEHAQYPAASEAIRMLARQRQRLRIVPQNLVEVWAVATRPVANNGLGLSTEAASNALGRVKRLFTVLAESEEIYAIWEALVLKHRVSGKATHDARLVAAMRVHGLTSILTFNTSDFTRFPEIKVVHPADVMAGKHQP